jgi:hypothetical protein
MFRFLVDLSQLDQHRHDFVVVLLGVHCPSSRRWTTWGTLRSQMVPRRYHDNRLDFQHVGTDDGSKFGSHRSDNLSSGARSQPGVPLPFHALPSQQMDSALREVHDVQCGVRRRDFRYRRFDDRHRSHLWFQFGVALRFLHVRRVRNRVGHLVRHICRKLSV